MAKLYVFNMVSLDGYFEGPDHNLDWHQTDEEFVEFAIEQLQSTGMILFGRKTYQMMADYWPRDEAFQSDPETAQAMRDMPKAVFSRTLESADWQNTSLIKTDAIEAIKKLKAESDKDLAIFGSSELCVSLIPSGVIDEYRLMINPIVIGAGTPIFDGLKEPLKLSLAHSRQFHNGNVLNNYQPL